MRKMRRLPALAMTVILAGIMGCGQTAAPDTGASASEAEVEKAVSEASIEDKVTGDKAAEEEASSEPEISPEALRELYAPVYAKLAEELYTSGDADWFELVYVDGDDIPEMVAVDSTNSWEEDEIFVYTAWENEPVLLISEIGPGMEGHEVILFEGENLIENSGAVSGERERYFDIYEGHARQILEAYADYLMDEDTGEGGYFLINGEEVTEKDYKDTLAGFLVDHKKALVLTCENMLEEDVSWQYDGYFHVDGTTVRPYYSYQNFCRVLEGDTDVEKSGSSQENMENAISDDMVLPEGCLYYAQVTAPDGYVNFRSGAGEDFGIISTIENGEILEVYIDNGDWLCVEYDDRTGWVAASQVTRQEWTD